MPIKIGQKKLCLILYEEKNAPKYLEIDKRLLRMVLFLLPLITIISILLVGGSMLVFNKTKKSAGMQDMREVNELRETTHQLTKDKGDLLNEISELQSKISSINSAPASPGGGNAAGISFLQLIRQIPGQRDLTNDKLLNTQEIKVVTDKTNLLFNFTMVNTTPDERNISGHVLVIMKANNQLSLYPIEGLGNELQMTFNQGEPFSFNRLRPVNTKFPLPLITPIEVQFRILVFSRTGDLLFEQLVTHKM